MFNAHLWISLLRVEESNGGGDGSGDDNGKHRKGRKGWYSVHLPTARYISSNFSSPLRLLRQSNPRPAAGAGCCTCWGLSPSSPWCSSRAWRAASPAYPRSRWFSTKYVEGAEQPFTIENYLLIKVHSVKNLFKEKMTPFNAGISNQNIKFLNANV